MNTTAIQKCLVNAWASEYALNATEVVNDSHFLTSCLSWVYPQAYYSAMYMLKAIAVASGRETLAIDYRYQVLVDELTAEGVFPNWKYDGLNFIEWLGYLRIRSENTMPQPPNAKEAVEMLHILRKAISKINSLGEIYLIQRLGYDFYLGVVNQQPKYILELIEQRLISQTA